MFGIKWSEYTMKTVKKAFKMEKRELILIGQLLHAHPYAGVFQTVAFTKTLPVSF